MIQTDCAVVCKIKCPLLKLTESVIAAITLSERITENEVASNRFQILHGGLWSVHIDRDRDWFRNRELNKW